LTICITTPVFFESEEGKREFEEWKAKRDLSAETVQKAKIDTEK